MVKAVNDGVQTTVHLVHVIVCSNACCLYISLTGNGVHTMKVSAAPSHMCTDAHIKTHHVCLSASYISEV